MRRILSAVAVLFITAISASFVLSGACASHGTYESIHAAARSGDLAAVKVFLKGGTPVDARDERSGNHTVLWAAIIAGHNDLAGFLISKGADPAVTYWGWTPMHWAASQDDTELAALLAKNGAPVDARAKGGATPLHCAAVSSAVEVGKLLIDLGADANALNDEGSTVLHYGLGRRAAK